MPKDNQTSDPLLKTLSKERMKRLMDIDSYLSRRGREDNPASIAELCDHLGITDLNQRRGIRKNIDSLWELSESDESNFKMIRVSSGKDRSVRYMIKPGHSLFRRTLADLFGRDLTPVEKKLAHDIFHNLERFQIPGLRHIEELTEVSASGPSERLAGRICIDLGVKAPERSQVRLFSGLFEAIAARKVIRLHYRPMRNISDIESEPSSILFCPWKLKLFGDRWSLIGMASSDSFILKFYLDQIVAFEDTGKVFMEAEVQRLDGIFDNIIGMDAPRHLCERHPDPTGIEEPEDIYVWVDPVRVQYLRSFPLHPSMDEIDDDCDLSRELREKYPGLPEGGSIFSMKVYVNHPLKQTLAMYLDRMIVLEPESLRLDLQQRVARMHDLYGAL